MGLGGVGWGRGCGTWWGRMGEGLWDLGWMGEGLWDLVGQDGGEGLWDLR